LIVRVQEELEEEFEIEKLEESMFES